MSSINREAIRKDIIRILIVSGPDGHCDGNEELTDYVMALVEPLVALLREARRTDHEPGCMAGWAQVGIVYEDKRCSCAAGEWNARIDAVLQGH